MKSKTILATLLSATFLMGSTMAFANETVSAVSETQTVQKMERRMNRDKNCDIKKISFGSFKGIDLTAEQKEKIKELRMERRKNLDKSLSPNLNMKSLLNMNNEIKEQVYAKDYSPEKVRAIVDNYAKILGDKIVYQTEIENKIFNVLTDEQKSIYKQNQKKFEQKWINRSNHRMSDRYKARSEDATSQVKGSNQ